MTERSKSSAAVATKPPVVIERTYRATLAELWDLWATKEGFESWWSPDGLRVEVHALDARPGGRLLYNMIVDGAEQIAAMKQMGLPVSHEERGTFTEFRLHQRLAITLAIDFVPDVPAYDNKIVVEFFPEGEHVRMVVTLGPMHNEEFTRLSTIGFTSALTKLDKRFRQSS